MDTTLRSKNDAVWAADLSARLRALQASFADDPADVRQRYLSEEISQALQDVAPGERSARLRALADYFPVWEGSGPSVAVAPPANDSPEELVRKLIALAPELSQPGRNYLARQLATAGFELPGASPAPMRGPSDLGEIPPELQKRLGIEADKSLDPARVLRLLAMLVEFVVTLDHLVWSVWKSLAPKSIVRRDAALGGDFRKLAAPYLLGDTEVSTAQVNLTVDKSRQLIAGLLAAIGATGETFARQYLARFSPIAIKAAADAEAGFFQGPEQKCWRRYVALFNETSGVAIEQEISKIVAKYAENLIMGAGSASKSNM